MLSAAEFIDDQLPQIDTVFLAFDAGSFKGFDSSVVQVLHLSGDVVDCADQKAWGSEFVED